MTTARFHCIRSANVNVGTHHTLVVELVERDGQQRLVLAFSGPDGVHKSIHLPVNAAPRLCSAITRVVAGVDGGKP